MTMDRSICRVSNTDDKTTMTITTEWWNDETIGVTILREGMVPLSGQTTVTQQLAEYPRADVTREKCIIDMRNELSGRDENQFLLRERRLSWKKRGWWRGGMDVDPIEDVVTLADMSIKWLNEQARLQSGNDKRIEEDKILQKSNDQLVAKLKAMEASKRSMEDKLYAKFLSVLNEKKKRLRALEEELSKSRTSAGAYDEDTDDDDRPDESSFIERAAVSEEPATVASTSGNCSKTVHPPLRCSPESESDEIVLKFDETPRDNWETEEDDPDQDLFSQ